jgi:hypothetical protein
LGAGRSSHDLQAYLARNLRDERIGVVATYGMGELEGQQAGELGPRRRVAAGAAR